MFDDDDPRRRVQLFRLQGWPNDRIADEMGTTEDIVVRWAAEADSISVPYLAENPERLREISEAGRPIYTPEQRRMMLGLCLTAHLPGVRLRRWHSAPRRVGTTASPSTTSRQPRSVIWWWRLSNGYEPIPRVRGVVHEDRELVLIAAPIVSQEDLEEHVRRWWNEWLQEVGRASD